MMKTIKYTKNIIKNINTYINVYMNRHESTSVIQTSLIPALTVLYSPPAVVTFSLRFTH